MGARHPPPIRATQARSAVPHTAHEVAGIADVLGGQLEEHLARLPSVELPQLVVVARALRHRLLKDRRVRRDAAHGVLFHHALELARLEKITGEEVDHTLCPSADSCCRRDSGISLLVTLHP